MGKYRVLNADPPYGFKSYSDKGQGRAPSAHYDTLTIEQVMVFRDPGTGLIPEEAAASDAVLFLWLPGIHTHQVGRIMKAWGFEFKGSGFVWVKPTDAVGRVLNEIERARGPNGLDPDGAARILEAVKEASKQKLSWRIGNGFGTRKNAEFCWLGSRGHPERIDAGVLEPIIAVREQHSKKPVEHYARIERLFAGPDLEMFARITRPGWDAWGDEVGLLDQGPVETRRIAS
jgi:N6-adenosine-specific RNA methylase IME4